MSSVLIVDDQEDLRYALTKVVQKQGYSVTTAASGQDAMEILQSTVIDLIFLDIGLPDVNGIDLIPTIKETSEDLDIVILTGLNDAKTAVDALRAGAIDYIVKPFELLEFTSILNRVLQARISRKKASLEHTAIGLDSIIGESPGMHRVKKTIQTAAEVDSPVLVSGETGTGKELVARAIHESRSGTNGVFVKIDCGTLSNALIESELFGHEKGAFTDARQEKKGLVEIAAGGTLFLDEIGNLPMDLQPKLLRLIEESTFRRVGGVKDISVKIRIVAATNADLLENIAKANFREDLYYRLNVIPIALPPLRDRGNDIILLAESFLHQFAKELRRSVQGFSPDGLARLQQHSWYGNIRELRNTIEREIIFNKGYWLTMNSLTEEFSVKTSDKDPLVSLKEMERRYIKKVLARVNNNKSKAARILEISRTTLREKL
ncbi:sigma-54 dependent transcriptional regulator [Desulforhopalus sp. IMCC35007]|uniref:sigma-54-dependent transcriptional regulator n=1 Tax=Desulforhopalus sp. IMCC35007 TaxID=2569543 RepID=UPI0010AE5C83|nr:sigma-54 dependent transcriptional regulator [Desulforhopalus sp. IMCC35007]TKB08447.1 sigma-54-dependent Fis family transcriptional regulator [Desulforhopalus sp. IMCC35007]